MTKQLFSKELEDWLKSGGKKTLQSLETVFQERSFAIIILLLMAIPALPIPTGGVTHVFELIVILLALEMVAGRKSLWLPERWRRKELGAAMRGKFVPYLIRRVKWLERFSRPRLDALMKDKNFNRLAGLALFLFALGAFLAPPFSGLDTLPALGAVIIALSLILGDIVIFTMGIIAGVFGIALTFILGSATLSLFKHFL